VAATISTPCRRQPREPGARVSTRHHAGCCGYTADGKQGDILLSGITIISDPAAKNWHLDVTSTNPLGVTNQEFISRAALGHQPTLFRVARPPQ
jgi:hypothetical protein